MKKVYISSLIYSIFFLLFSNLTNAQVVINEVYGGGGNAGATYKNDFIELYNNSSTPVDLTGWSIQYASATGTSWQVTNLSGVIPANGYYLIQEAAGTGGTADLPTPNATGTINMSGTAGKVALVSSTTALTVACPPTTSVIDLVGFGTTANCYEGSGRTPAPSNILSVQRSPIGNDTQNNNSDFATGAPSPMNAVVAAPAATISVSAGSAAAEPLSTGTFTIHFSAATTTSTDVDFAFTGTAAFGTDYTVSYSAGSVNSTSSTGTLTVPLGTSSVTVTITPVDDNAVEDDETISLTLSNPTQGYSTGTAAANINFTDNDASAPVDNNAPISLTGPYTQNFNSLATTGTANTLSIQGWSLLETGGGTRDNDLYASDNGGSNTGDTYSYGTTEKALGSLRSGSLISSYGAYFVNNTGSTITSLKIDYTGEQWRLGTTGRADRLDFQYSLNATDLATGTWTDVDQLDFSSPLTTGTAGVRDGNDPAYRTMMSNTITGLSIPAGATFFIRWNDSDASGSDDGLAIDDLTVEANPKDDSSPAITSLFPVSAATNISTNFSASLNFIETVQKGTGSILVTKTSDNSIVKTIDVNSDQVTISTTSASFNLSGLEENTGYSIMLPTGAFTDLSGNPSADTTWSFTTGTLFYSADFNTCSPALADGFTQFSTTGAINWTCTPFGRDSLAPAGTAATPYGVQMNGFANGTNVPNVDWLISPSFDLTATTYPLLSFYSRTAFNGLPLQLKVSTNYVSGDPANATWTDINGKFPQQTSNVWTLSSGINLSAFKGSNVHFAFVYTSTPDDGARWTIDDVSINNSATPPPPSLTVSATDVRFDYVPAGSSADKTITFTGNDLIAGVTVQATGNFQVSKDGTNFSTAITYDAVEVNDVATPVFVRFAPGTDGQDYTGTVTVTTSSSSSTVNLKGTSIDPATTLEVVNWNIEWFGSTEFGPTNENQQEQNIQKILINTGSDVYALSEVVDEARLARVVSSMPGYTYTISNFGSHTNTTVNSASALADAQKLAFIYKTSVLSNVTAEPLLSAGINSAADLSNPAYNYWSSGRFPYMMTADVTLNCVTKKVRFILVHAKANTSPTTQSYNRRENGADTLHQVLQTLYPNDNIIILGDFNDDFDQSITAGFTTTSWSAFKNDDINYEVLTLPLSEAGKKSTVSYNDMIDHVVVSNEMEQYYMSSTATVLSDVTSLVSNYGSTTTDHYPVFTRYRFEKPTTKPTVTVCPAVPVSCANSTGTYTIPAFTATPYCGGIKYSYVVTGATERSGLTNDASGTFNMGTSTITWTATDDFGNTASCQTPVVVNRNPMVTIPDAMALPSGVLANTAYVGYSPASSVTLNSTVTGGAPAYSYNWSNGATDASATVTPVVNTTYTLTVTDANGCSATATKTIAVMDVRAGKKLDKVAICHKGNRNEISSGDVSDHLNHGDMLGSCSGMNPAITQRSGITQELAFSKLSLSAYPNPTASHFTLTIRAENASDKISIKVFDLLGRVIDKKENLRGNQNIRIGENYGRGVYFAEVTRGVEKVVVKLVKQ